MPSKKKKIKSSRDKARKGDNSKKKEQQQQGTLDTQMEQLKIEDDSGLLLLEEAIKLATAEKEALEAAAAGAETRTKCVVECVEKVSCRHGYNYDVPAGDHFNIEDFGQTFISGLFSLGRGANMGECFDAALAATHEKYAEVWDDSSKLKMIVSLFLFNGTTRVIEENLDNAQLFATCAFYFEDFIAVNLDKRSVKSDATKLIELSTADEHTLVKYLRKNIPCKCNCLHAKYKEVKSIAKMGVCRNVRCKLPDRKVEHRSMLYCTRCRAANYCSRECQKAAWPEHKEVCVRVS